VDEVIISREDIYVIILGGMEWIYLAESKDF
jgi:hypothetical protein